MMDWKSDKRFSDFVSWVLLREGSAYEDVPGDDGGPTKYGIDHASHDWLSVDQIRNLTADQASAIYYRESWLHIHADEMPFPVGELVSDIHINGGQAIQWLQGCLRQHGKTVALDGDFGPQTAAALDALDAGVIAECMLTKRNAYFEALAQKWRHDRQFLAGWLARDKEFVGYVSKESLRLGLVVHPADFLNV